MIEAGDLNLTHTFADTNTSAQLLIDILSDDDTDGYGFDNITFLGDAKPVIASQDFEGDIFKSFVEGGPTDGQQSEDLWFEGIGGKAHATGGATDLGFVHTGEMSEGGTAGVIAGEFQLTHYSSNSSSSADLDFGGNSRTGKINFNSVDLSGHINKGFSVDLSNLGASPGMRDIVIHLLVNGVTEVTLLDTRVQADGTIAVADLNLIHTFADNDSSAQLLIDIYTDNDTNGYGIDNVHFFGTVGVPTPAYGVEVAKVGDDLSWSVDHEDGVVSYQVQKNISGNWTTVTTVAATGEANASYKVTVGEGEFRVVAVDASGFSQPFAVEATDAFIALKQGWNLISVPFDNADLSELESTTKWGWDGAKYIEVTEAKALQGLWVYTDIASEITISGDVAISATATLNSGWNLVGPAENCAAPARHTVFSWDKTYQKVLEGDNALIQGRGYWIFSDSEATVNLK